MQFDTDAAFDKMKQKHSIYVRLSESALSEQTLLTEPKLFLCQLAALCRKDLRTSALCSLTRYKAGMRGIQDLKSAVPALHAFFCFIIQTAFTRLQVVWDRREKQGARLEKCLAASIPIRPIPRATKDSLSTLLY